MNTDTTGQPRPQDASNTQGAKHIGELLPAIMARIVKARGK